MESKNLQTNFSTRLKSTQPLVQTPASANCEICVIVPVRDEATGLKSTLTALANQFDFNQRRLDFSRYEVILFANNCTDRSAAIARQFAQQHPLLALHVVEKTLPPTEAYIGRVRQILMDEAYLRLSHLRRSRPVIASTDGDSQVAPDWVAANLAEIAKGADAVGGRILVERQGLAALNAHVRACHLREVGYRSLIAELETYLDPDPFDRAPRHYQHYGASLAVTAEMYAQAGGMPAVRSPEDVAFYRALVRANAQFRHSPLVRVVTSARQIGRTPIGLANQLSEWAKMGAQQRSFKVESAQAIETRLQARNRLRMLWRRILNGHSFTVEDVMPLAHTLGVTTQWLRQALIQVETFGILLEEVEQRQQQEEIWSQRWSPVEIKQAIHDLRLRVSDLRQTETVSSILQARSRIKLAQTNPADIVPHVTLLDAAV